VSGLHVEFVEKNFFLHPHLKNELIQDSKKKITACSGFRYIGIRDCFGKIMF
jgi:hypothetical protein